MKILFFLTLCAVGHCSPPDAFFRALHHVETSGRTGPIRGDSGRALGPLQIHYGYWRDAGVPGNYSDCQSLEYSVRVVSAYMRTYAPKAWRNGDWRTLARIHNGGPSGHRVKATLRYLRKVELAMMRLNAI